MSRIVTIGIAGHVDHGKTSLVRSLTGIDTDRMKEEKQRGLSIEFGIAQLTLPLGMHVSLVDVPGHTDFMKNTIRGLSSVDAAILVVAADDGVMPQTREHLEILKFLDVRTGLVVLSKTDIVDQDTLQLAKLELLDLTAGSFLGNCPILHFSAVNNQGRDEILTAIEAMSTSSESAKCNQAPFRMFIDQIRILQGYGTVVSGTVLSGSIRQGDKVEILPSGRTARVRSLQTHHTGIDTASEGSRVGINLHGISSNEIFRGIVLAEPGYIQLARFLNCALSISSYAKRPLLFGERVRIYLGTAVTSALVVLMEAHELGPDDTGLAQLRLTDPIGALPGDRYVITPLNSPMILGGGRVLETTPVKFRKAHACRIIPVLKALFEGEPMSLVNAIASARPEIVLSARELSHTTGILEDLLEKALNEGVSSGLLVWVEDRTCLSAEFFHRTKDLVVENVEDILSRDRDKNSVGSAHISSSLPNELNAQVMDLILGDLVREGRLLAVNGGFTTETLSQGRTFEHDSRTGQILSIIETSGMAPVTITTVLEKLNQKQDTRGIRKSLEFLLSKGESGGTGVFAEDLQRCPGHPRRFP